MCCDLGGNSVAAGSGVCESTDSERTSLQPALKGTLARHLAPGIQGNMQLTLVPCKLNIWQLSWKILYSHVVVLAYSHVAEMTCEYASTATRNCECKYRRTRMLPCGDRRSRRRAGFGFGSHLARPLLMPALPEPPLVVPASIEARQT